MKQYEYKIVTIAEQIIMDGNATRLEEILNEYGKEGWEFVYRTKQSNMSLYFKREISK